MCSALGTTRPPACNVARASFNAARMAFVEAARPKRSMRIPAAGVFRTVSTGGRLRRCMEFIVSERQFSGQDRRRITCDQAVSAASTCLKPHVTYHVAADKTEDAYSVSCRLR
jgi:hypothetical protein